MAAVVAVPGRVWTDRVILAMKEIVEERLRQHYPRFKGVTVSVDILSGRAFFVELRGKEGTFDTEGREVLCRFFTGDFKLRAKPLLEEYLGWNNPKVCSNARDRSTSCYVWQITCRDEEIDEGRISKRNVLEVVTPCTGLNPA